MAKQRQADPSDLLRKVRRLREEMEPPLIYRTMVEERHLDPSTPIAVKVIVTKRDRHKVGKLTQRVWDSLNPDGTVDPEKAVPIHAVNTQELPEYRVAGEANGAKTAG